MSNSPITITDTATPYLEFIAKTKPDWTRKAMKSVGWMMQKEIKAGIKSGSPGGHKYANFMPPTMRAQFEAAFGAKVRRAYLGYTPLGKMFRAVGYQYDARSQSVKVGWLSSSAKRLGEQIERGYTKQITEPMRRTLFAGGFQLAKGKTSFRIKPRKTFGPMKTSLQPKLVPYLEAKIGEYALGKSTQFASSRRAYKVR